MERKIGTVSRGVRCPIIREGDDIASIMVNSVLEAAESEGFELRDRDVVAVTESVVARSQGNYASINAIAKDVEQKLGGETVGVIFPILSRNRFAICLKGIAMGAKKIVLMLNYPSDEVGNALVSLDQLDEAGINPYTDVFSPSRNMLHPQLAANTLESVMGLLTFSAPRCPHLGCALKYNPAEHSWDCPCHGSRFSEDGKLIDNPATDDHPSIH